MTRHVWMTLGVLSFVLVAEGCRRVYTFIPVEGTVTQDGKPLEGVQVIFFADPDSGTEGPRSMGTTDAAGHYRLQTDHGDAGAVVGRHRVCIWVPFSPEERLTRRLPREGTASSELKNSLDLKRSQKQPAPKVQSIYASFNETPLRAEIRSGNTQTIDFNIP